MTQNDWSGNYERFKDYLKSDEDVVEEVIEDTEYLDWYENWKKENFSNEK